MSSIGQSESALEAVGDDEVAAAQVMDGRVPEAEQGRVDSAAQDVQDVLDAGLTVRGQAPEVGSADHDGAGAERHRLHDPVGLRNLGRVCVLGSA